MSDDGSQKCVQSVEFLVRAYSEWRSMCSSQRSAEAEKARSTLTLNERTRLVTAELARVATEASRSGRHEPRWVDTYKDHAEFGYVFRENARDVLNKQNPGSVKATLEFLASLLG